MAAQSIRVNVDTLEKLMTMVSELVLTRNQLLELMRWHEKSEFVTTAKKIAAGSAARLQPRLVTATGGG